MTTDVVARPIVTVKNKIGLVLAGLLGLSDVFAPFLGPDQNSLPEGTQGPPLPVLIAGAVLGLVTLIAVAIMWRTGSRVAARIIAGTRILSVLAAAPAFFASGVPAVLVVLVAVFVVLTVISLALVLSRPKAT